MSHVMPEAYELYKPLRNHLRKVRLFESLGVIRAYMSHMQFGTAFPKDIEVEPYFLRARDPIERKVFEWELDIIAREIILNSTNRNDSASETLRRCKYFSRTVNKLKDLENNLSALHPTGSILLELHRVAHRQFAWQKRPDRVWIARYFRIFGQGDLDAIIQRKIGLTARELYRIGLAFTGLYLEKYVLNYPPTVEIADLSREKLDRFLAHFAVDLETLKGMAEETQEINENYAYMFNPPRIYP